MYRNMYMTRQLIFCTDHEETHVQRFYFTMNQATVELNRAAQQFRKSIQSMGSNKYSTIRTWSFLQQRQQRQHYCCVFFLLSIVYLIFFTNKWKIINIIVISNIKRIMSSKWSPTTAIGGKRLWIELQLKCVCMLEIHS